MGNNIYGRKCGKSRLENLYSKPSAHYRVIIFFLTLFLWDSVLFSQLESPISQSPPWKEIWKYFDKTNSALPTNSIRCVVEDKKRNYWIGTWGGGLVKFDGKNWTVFNTENSKLPHNNIYCIAFDRRGNLLIGTFGGGVAKFDGKNEWTVYSSSNSGLPDDWIYSIAIDKKSNLWIGTYSKGLAIFNGKNWRVFNKSNSKLPADKVTAIYIDRNDNKIIATSDKIIFIQDSVWKTEAEMNIKSESTNIYWIAPYVDNKILMCYKFGGVVIYDGTTFKLYTKNNSKLPFEGFYSISFDKKKIIWAGSFGSGAVRFDGEKWEVFDKSNSGLKDNMVFSLFTDSRNNKWFSTYNNGISIYNEDGVKL